MIILTMILLALVETSKAQEHDAAELVEIMGEVQHIEKQVLPLASGDFGALDAVLVGEYEVLLAFVKIPVVSIKEIDITGFQDAVEHNLDTDVTEMVLHTLEQVHHIDQVLLAESIAAASRTEQSKLLNAFVREETLLVKLVARYQTWLAFTCK